MPVVPVLPPDVEAFFKKNFIAYRQNFALSRVLGRYAIAVFLKNAPTSRVVSAAMLFVNQ